MWAAFGAARHPTVGYRNVSSNVSGAEMYRYLAMNFDPGLLSLKGLPKTK